MAGVSEPVQQPLEIVQLHIRALSLTRAAADLVQQLARAPSTVVASPRSPFSVQDFIDAQDELSVLDFMRKYGMPERINEEVTPAVCGRPYLETRAV